MENWREERQLVEPVRIMCLNTWGGTLAQELLKYITEDPPEVLCLQEVIQSPGATREWLTYRDGDHVLRQRANIYGELCRTLPDHAAAFCPAATGVLWDGEEPVQSRWGVATFVHHCLAVIAQAQGFVHKQYSPRGYGDHPRSRSAHAVRLYDHRNDRAITVAHMHGLRNRAGKGDTPEREAQAMRLIALWRQVAEAGDLSVICGDFNVEPESRTLELMREEGFVELVTKGGYPGTRTSHYPKNGRFADYMLTDAPSAVIDFEVVRSPEVSDHTPLILTL